MLPALVGRDRELGVLLGCLDEAERGPREPGRLRGRAGHRQDPARRGARRPGPGEGCPDRVGSGRRDGRRAAVLALAGGHAGAGGRGNGRCGRGCRSGRGRCRAVAGGACAEVRRGGTARARGREESPAARRTRRLGRRGRAVAAVGAVPGAHGARRAVSLSSSAAATLQARSPPWPRSPTPPRSSCAAWSGPPSASRSARIAGRAASDAELAAVYDATAGNPFFVSELARQLADGAASRGPYPGRCSTRSASASGSSPRTARRRCVPRRCSGPGSRYRSSQR